MGVDVYLTWPGMDETDTPGYLRESYEGSIYPSQFLVREAFESEKMSALISAADMRRRMTEITEPANVFLVGHVLVKFLRENFAKKTNTLTEATGEPGDFKPDPETDKEKIHADLQQFMRKNRQRINREMKRAQKLPPAMPVERAIAARVKQLGELGLNTDTEYENTVRANFYKFIELAEQKERETGQPCTVTVSY